MRSKFTLLKRGVKNPTSVPPYVLGKLFPNSGWGSVVEYRETFITFSRGGFVQGAQSRPPFCARQYYDVGALRQLVADFAGDVDAALEVGCGYGRLTPWLAEFASDVHGIDPNEEVVADARRLYPDLEFRADLAQDLSHSDHAFDLVVSWTTLHHIPPAEIDAVAAELLRVLTPDGTLILCEQTESLGRENAWGRTEKEYERLFDPLKLVASRPRPIEPTFTVDRNSPSTGETGHASSDHSKSEQKTNRDGTSERTVHPHERLLVFTGSDRDTTETSQVS